LKVINTTAIEIKQHAVEIEANAFKTAFSGQIPREFLNTIQSKAFKGPFLRDSIRATWRFEIESNDRLIAHVDNLSIIKNVTDTVQVYAPKLFFDERQGHPIIKRASIGGVVLDIERYKLERARSFEPDLVLNLPTQEIQPHSQLEVMMDFTFVRQWTDWELFTTLYPCNSMSLRFYYPDLSKCKNEYFKIDQLGDLFIKRHDHENYVDVDVQDKILPDQGLLFMWRFVPLGPTSDVPSEASPNIPSAS
jgi:hypothetical protein